MKNIDDYELIGSSLRKYKKYIEEGWIFKNSRGYFLGSIRENKEEIYNVAGRATKNKLQMIQIPRDYKNYNENPIFWDLKMYKIYIGPIYFVPFPNENIKSSYKSISDSLENFIKKGEVEEKAKNILYNLDKTSVLLSQIPFYGIGSISLKEV